YHLLDDAELLGRDRLRVLVARLLRRLDRSLHRIIEDLVPGGFDVEGDNLATGFDVNAAHGGILHLGNLRDLPGLMEIGAEMLPVRVAGVEWREAFLAAVELADVGRRCAGLRLVLARTLELRDVDRLVVLGRLLLLGLLLGRLLVLVARDALGLDRRLGSLELLLGLDLLLGLAGERGLDR